MHRPMSPERTQRSVTTALALLLLPAFLTIVPTVTQANTLPIITNVTTTADGDSIVIGYDIEDPDGDVMRVMLYEAGTDDPPFEPPVARGDIAEGVTTGTSKRIVLDVDELVIAGPDTATDSDPGTGNTSEPLDFIPRLLAHDGTGYGGEMVAVDAVSGPDFMVDRYELTNMQYLAFVRSDGYERMEYWIIDDGSLEIQETGWNYAGRFRWHAPKHWDLQADPPWSQDPYSNVASSPVLGISWFEAYAYCKWAGRRLPTSGEYREAAGLDDAAFPWGDELLPPPAPLAEDADADAGRLYGYANAKLGRSGYRFEGFTDDGYDIAAPVGSMSPEGDSPAGIADAYGNVWEWCSDVVAVVDYTTYSCATRPLKGGSWATSMTELEDASKDLCPLYRTDTAGFRCYR